MRFVRFAWIREIKYRKYHEIILKISPKDKKITPIDKKLSPIDSKISPKDKKISPIKKIWKLCWGDEVKGEGYILNHYCPIKKGNSIFKTVELYSFMQYFAMNRT